MSAAPKIEPEPDRDAEGWALLDGLRRRMDDQQQQARRTHDQVQQLAESIAALVSAQRKRTRWLNLNSFGAYVLFTVLCGAAAFALYTSRAGELVDQRDRAVADRDAAVKRADASDARAVAADAKAAADTKAAVDAKAAEPAAEHDGAGKSAATAMTAFRAGRYAEARAPLETAVAAEPSARAAPLWRYALGVIAAKDGRLDDAIAALDAAIAAGVGEDDAHYQLAIVLDRKSDFARARVEYDRFAAAHPKMQLATFARQRSAALRAAATPAPPAAPVAPPAAAPATTEPAQPATTPPATDTP